MHIRKIEQEDLARVSSICMDAFMCSVAPSLSNEGVDTFRRIASIDSFLSRLKGDNNILVFEDNGELKGVIELKEGHHLAMLFVDPKSQNRGIGRKLFSEVIAYARTEILTVSASINSVPTYLKYGFVCIGQPDEKYGLKYQPMEFKLNKSSKKDARKRASS